jgi:hypothetical protein
MFTAVAMARVFAASSPATAKATRFLFVERQLALHRYAVTSVVVVVAEHRWAYPLVAVFQKPCVASCSVVAAVATSVFAVKLKP